MRRPTVCGDGLRLRTEVAAWPARQSIIICRRSGLTTTGYTSCTVRPRVVSRVRPLAVSQARLARR